MICKKLKGLVEWLKQEAWQSKRADYQGVTNAKSVTPNVLDYP